MYNLPSFIMDNIKVAQSTECWEWQLAKANGYGSICLQGIPLRVHRLVFELLNGLLPSHIFVCHKCDNPCCCNPSHLFAGTARDNIRDMLAKNRNKGKQVIESKELIAEIVTARLAGVAVNILSNKYGVPGSTIIRYAPIHGPQRHARGNGPASLREFWPEIKTKYIAGIPKCKLATQYGTSVGTINYIVYGYAK